MININKKKDWQELIIGIKSSQSGFTLLELLISSFLFVLLLIAISGIYVSFSRVQARTNASQKMLNDTQYVLEIMAREIRNDVIFDFDPTISGACADLLGDIDKANCILLLKEDGRLIAFAEDTNTLRYLVLDCDADYSSCTTNDEVVLIAQSFNYITVEDLAFVITPSISPSDGSSDLHPKVTIKLQTEVSSARESSQINHYLQTTVSSRIYQR
jgi:prepilin-type N-terminal cleavage/methylation domain-containing protein